VKPLTATQKEWVDRTLASLTLREKIGQTAQERLGPFENEQTDSIERYFSQIPLGSVFCGGEIIKGAGASLKAIREGVESCQKASNIPLLVAGDLENGAGAAIKGMTMLPHTMALGAANDEALAHQYGQCIATGGRVAGFNWTFAPVVDLLQNWLNPVLSNRCLGDRPGPVGRLASAIIRGIQENGMAACAKHFPGDGVDFRDQHLITSVNSLSEKEWWENHGRVFSEVISAGVHTVMAGHIALPWLDPKEAKERRFRPATTARRILIGLLRERMGFSGVIVSDALEMAGFTGWAPYEERIIQAFNAGIDIMLWPSAKYLPVMERALNDGRVSIERLDESVRRILSLKATIGLCGRERMDTHSEEVEVAKSDTDTNPDENCRTTACEVAKRSITLVRNDALLLPLDPSKARRILLHIAVNPLSGSRDCLDAFAERLRARGISLDILENGNCLDVWNLEATGKRWDAYLVLFSLQVHQIKNAVRPVGPMAEVMWTLQNVETIRPIVVSLATPYLLNEMPFLDTLVNCYSTCEATIDALDKAIFGEAPFSIHSPVDIGGQWYVEQSQPVS
jgi:beta-N-acetylhexosaminidase